MATLKLKTSPRLKLAPDEELFLEPIQGRITCRACDREETVPLGYPALLCSACLFDLSATACRVADEYAETMTVFFRAGEALQKAALNNEWYAKTERARSEVEPVIFARAWEAARARGGEPAVLIGMREWLDETAMLMRRAELRYITAAPELLAAREARGEPIDV